MDVKIALKEHLSTELNNQFAALEPPELFIGEVQTSFCLVNSTI
ncbi:hypothetical protein PQG02_27735 [Nostoc sp. UHCC 0926]|nr:hypothetical protein [Nostoc sp. UHCC 0926]WDD32405.1 hypothetical protein PQG02_27735 [Nostoc sp. UHCC 0926]